MDIDQGQMSLNFLPCESGKSSWRLRLAQLKKALSRGLFLFWSEHVLMFGLLLT
ncbi:hypothetical protein [Comamonas thiooxydans]|uniref:hypothetical protein n=1 Tax=Comamonas thiooxydans TaxID=363952 RepID=UPI0013DD7152|nr:hypothetical protein [Comamonas thiooxydans]